MDAITGDTDSAFDEDELLTVGFEDRFVEDDGFAAADVPVGDEGRPGGGWREGGTFDEDVIANQKRAGHGGRGDGEVLKDEGEDKEGDDDGAADRG